MKFRGFYFVTETEPPKEQKLAPPPENCLIYSMYSMYTLSSSVIGSYLDITSRDFLVVQQDHALRRSWDAYILQLETVDREEASGSEVVHWVMKFPVRN